MFGNFYPVEEHKLYSAGLVFCPKNLPEIILYAFYIYLFKDNSIKCGEAVLQDEAE